MTGVFIVFEGGEGCGKDANISYLRDVLRDRDDLIYTREPGGTPIGERVRDLLMDHAHIGMAVETELLLFLASRAELLAEVIRPALAAGQHVISNRFALSTIAYQIYRNDRHEYLPFLNQITETLLPGIEPHYILLDVEPKVGLGRARTRPEQSTRFDLESLAVHERVRRGYLDAVKHFPHTLIDANRPLSEVQDDVAKSVFILPRAPNITTVGEALRKEALCRCDSASLCAP